MRCLDNIENLCIIQVGGARVNLEDFRSGGFESVVEICSSSQHLNTAESIFQAFMASADQKPYPQHGTYENVNPQQGSYQSLNVR